MTSTAQVITNNTRVQLGVLISLIAAVVAVTVYIVTIKNTNESTNDYQDRRLSAIELRQDDSDRRQAAAENSVSDLKVLLAGVITKLDILLQINGYNLKPPK